MTGRTLVISAAIAMAATLGLAGSASACCKEKFVRSKPHVNVGTANQARFDNGSGETVVIGGLMGGPVLSPRIHMRPNIFVGTSAASGMRLGR
jgi:hypothetical protein